MSISAETWFNDWYTTFVYTIVEDGITGQAEQEYSNNAEYKKTHRSSSDWTGHIQEKCNSDWSRSIFNHRIIQCYRIVPCWSDKYIRKQNIDPIEQQKQFTKREQDDCYRSYSIEERTIATTHSRLSIFATVCINRMKMQNLYCFLILSVLCCSRYTHATSIFRATWKWKDIHNTNKNLWVDLWLIIKNLNRMNYQLSYPCYNTSWQESTSTSDYDIFYLIFIFPVS